MRCSKLTVAPACAIVLLAAAAAVMGDWNRGDPHKMHYPQLPDPQGWDICVLDQWVADDFQCSESGKITDIHFWISWKEDRVLPDILQLTPDISIWSDGAEGPGRLLWQWNGDGQVNVAGPFLGNQGWACPSAGEMLYPDHQMYFQVNITQIPEPFEQTKDTVYWLVVRVDAPAPFQLGWKTSTNEPPGPIWGSPALWSPDRLAWQPVMTGTTFAQLHDLAFVITGEPTGPPPIERPTLQVGDWINPEPWHNWFDPARPLPIRLHVTDPCDLIQAVEFSFMGPDGTWVPFFVDEDGNEPKVTTLDDDIPPEEGDGWSAVLEPGMLPPGTADQSVQLRARSFMVDSFFDVFVEIEVDPSPPDTVEVITEVQEGELIVDVNPNPRYPEDIEFAVIEVEPKEDEFVKGIPPLNQLKQGRQYGGDYHCAPTATAACLKYFEGQGDDDIAGGLSGDDLTDALAKYEGCNEGGKGTYFGEWVSGIRNWIDDHGGGYTVRSFSHFNWNTARDELERCQDVLVRLQWPNGFGHALTLNSIHNTPNADGTIRIDLMDPYGGDIAYGDLDPGTGSLSGFEGQSGNAGTFTHMIIICPEEDNPGGNGGDPKPGPDPGPWGPIPLDPGKYFVRVTVVDRTIHAATIINIVDVKPADFGDAPERALAYPSTCKQGLFPTCIQAGPAGSFVRHTIGGAFFGASVDGEPDGNAGKCPVFTPNTYNQDECHQDGDAGLIRPAGFTIVGPVGSETVVPCVANDTSALGTVCTPAMWGQNIDIQVTNRSNTARYVNVLVDWDKSGTWGGAAACLPCAGVVVPAPEHILLNAQVPAGYTGPLSAVLTAAQSQFLIGPNPGYVWARFTISDDRVPDGWDGSGIFGDGESEDYLIKILAQPVVSNCDWKEGDEFKMHHPQLPDLAPTGIDVDMTYTPLADDFRCTETGKITDIHFWGSFADDCLPAGGPGSLTFEVSIWSDIPAGADRHSMPGQLLWGPRVFTPCDYNVRKMPEDMVEGWYDPMTGFFDPQNHVQAFQYNLCIDEDEAFEQKAGEVYWLMIKDIVEPGFEPDYTFGWKTTRDDLRWNDDAVYRGVTGGWMELRYPEGHPFAGESMDLAFVITGVAAPPPPADWGDAPDPTYPTLGAAGASHVIFPRIYMGATVDPEPDGQPTAAADGDDTDPDGDDEDGVTFDTPLIPGQPAQITVNVSQANVFVSVWIDYDIDGGWAEPQDYVIQSVPALVAGNNPFGFVVPATASVGQTYARVRYTTAPNIPFGGPAPDGEVEDYLVKIEPPYEPKPPVPHLKWSQPPIEIDPVPGTAPLYCGWDEPSLATKELAGAPAVWQVAADDFRCLGSMPITSVHWWGSYLHWLEQEPPVQARPVYWHIGFWSNAPMVPGAAPFSRPDKLLHSIRVQPERVEEVWAGMDEFPNPNRQPESCFQYHVKLEPEEWFRQNKFLDQTHGDVFWISIVPVYQGFPGPEFPWGWKTRPAHWMDDAVTFEYRGDTLPVGTVVDPATAAPIEDALVGCPEIVESFDLAFELDTDPEYVKWEQPFTGLRHWPHYEDVESMGIEHSVTVTISKYADQQPDLSDEGMDVDATVSGMFPPQVLADDFPCTVTGPLTHITVYGSWLRDVLPGSLAPDPQAVMFTLSIHENVPPENSPTGYSMPGRLLWSKQFDAGDFGAVPLARDLTEGYYVPCVSPPVYIWPGDSVCWRYDFLVPEAEAFHQEGTEDAPKTYWLDVQARPIGPTEQTRFGWKTSQVHWEDDAVWTKGNEPLPSSTIWSELVYPEQHPKAGESIDLAFEVGTTVTRQEVEVRRLVADDWRCTGRRPVTAAVWWGSYIGYRYRACECLVTPPPVKPDYFLLSIWTDVPAEATSPTPFSHPGKKVWEYKAYDYDEVLVGFDKHPEQAGGPGLTGPREPVFRYSVKIPGEHWFYQDPDEAIYWFSVVAVYKSATEIPYPWGWTNHPWSYQDNAVVGFSDPAGTGEWTWEELFDQTGESEDMSFMLFTDPDCFPWWYSTHTDWVRYGKPDCWCNSAVLGVDISDSQPPDYNAGDFQCDGDAATNWENPFLKYRVFVSDLNVLSANWKKRDVDIGTPNGPDPCADIDHKWENPFLKYRVFINDLNILVANWKKRAADLPGDCPRPE